LFDSRYDLVLNMSKTSARDYGGGGRFVGRGHHIGLAWEVQRRVWSVTQGKVLDLCRAAVEIIERRLSRGETGFKVNVLVWCHSGRHRSVAVAEFIADWADQADLDDGVCNGGGYDHNPLAIMVVMLVMVMIVCAGMATAMTGVDAGDK